MKPFDLEAALAGKPVVTRDGQKVTQLVKFECRSNFSIRAVIDGSIYAFTEAGKFSNANYESSYDLFMAPTERTVWVNLYPHCGTSQVSGYIFSSQEAADRRGSNRIGGMAHPFTYEE